MSLKTKSLLLIFLIVLADQVLKIWIKTTMMLGEEIRVFDWFYIHFVENPGMAFGMEFFGKYGKLFLSIFRIVAVVAIGYYLLKMIEKRSPVGLIICISMILAGAIGNILDSAFYGLLFSDSYSQVSNFLPEGGGYASFLHGKVVDMFYFPLFRGAYPSWIPIVGGDDFLFFRPVFNIADSSITIGILSIIIFQKRFFKEK
ncbi:MAG: lipoprotein signal peptidase [Marinilabiliaceae bacterium]|nr:lipoprotein signal peptidase [Marinilabiliaceae bacterium]